MAKVRKEVGRAIPLPSPSGNIARPKIVTVKNNGVEYEEAHYYDPVTGQFFRKVVVAEITETKDA